MQGKNYHSKIKNSEEPLNPSWNASNLFYIYLSELDMDFRDAFYINEYDKMDKICRLKYMRIKEFIKKIASPEEIKTITDKTLLNSKLGQLKKTNNDHSTRFNNNVIEEVITILENKMILMDSLMSKSGMNLLLKEKNFKPAALGGDDW